MWPSIDDYCWNTMSRDCRLRNRLFRELLAGYKTRIDDYGCVKKIERRRSRNVSQYDWGIYWRPCDVYSYMFCLSEEKMFFVKPYWTELRSKSRGGVRPSAWRSTGQFRIPGNLTGRLAGTMPYVKPARSYSRIKGRPSLAETSLLFFTTWKSRL